MPTYHILTDDDVANYLTMREAITYMEGAFREQANGTLVAPPRFAVKAPKGRMVFTAGAATGFEHALGFRVYNVFPPDVTVEQIQLVTVFDSEHGGLKGIILGQAIGLIRTAAINGVAMDHMARQDVSVLAIIGAGSQAHIQVQAAMAVRDFTRINIYSRTMAKAQKFRAEILQQFDVSCSVVPSAKVAVQDADVVLCTTTSRTPVIDSQWLQAGTHIHGIGPKAVGASELPPDIAARCAVIATDSLAQLKGYPNPFFIQEHERIVGLDQIVAGNREGRRTENEITLFCSTGLAGTEVVLANRVIERHKKTIGSL